MFAEVYEKFGDHGRFEEVGNYSLIFGRTLISSLGIGSDPLATSSCKESYE